MTRAPKQIKEINKIIEKTARWPNESIRYLIGILDCNVGYESDIEFADALNAVLDRRSKEVASGKVRAYTMEEFHAKARKALERGSAKIKNKK